MVLFSSNLDVAMQLDNTREAPKWIMGNSTICTGGAEYVSG